MERMTSDDNKKWPITFKSFYRRLVFIYSCSQCVAWNPGELIGIIILMEEDEWEIFSKYFIAWKLWPLLIQEVKCDFPVCL